MRIRVSLWRRYPRAPRRPQRARAGGHGHRDASCSTAPVSARDHSATPPVPFTAVARPRARGRRRRRRWAEPGIHPACRQGRSRPRGGRARNQRPAVPSRTRPPIAAGGAEALGVGARPDGDLLDIEGERGHPPLGLGARGGHEGVGLGRGETHEAGARPAPETVRADEDSARPEQPRPHGVQPGPGVGIERRMPAAHPARVTRAVRWSMQRSRVLGSVFHTGALIAALRASTPHGTGESTVNAARSASTSGAPVGHVACTWSRNFVGTSATCALSQLKRLRAQVRASGRRSYFPSRRTTEPFSKK